MKLSVKERFLLLNTLPLNGTHATLKIVRQLRERLSFTESEHAEFEIKEPAPDRVVWNQAKERDVEITIGPKGTSIIVDTLKKLDESGNLSLELVTLADKFLANQDDALDPEVSVEKEFG